jgi:hypothetical protein
VLEWNMTEVKQAIAGLTPPEVAEARIRDVWPSVARAPLFAGLGKFFINTIFLAPLGWAIMALPYFGKLLPIIAIRYSLTNRRVLIKHGWTWKVRSEVSLAEIEDVQLDPKSIDNFFRSANLIIHRSGSAPLTLTAVPDPESFRHAILAARNAWAPGKAKTLPFIPASSAK